MANHVEPMDVDSSVCEFDNKENSFRHNNLLPRTPCTEKGYEELDVSELNMKLRYSVTPSSSPMSKSYTANCLDNRSSGPNPTLGNESDNMSRSLHSTLTINESVAKPPKVLPLQVLSTDQGQIVDGNRNALRPLDSTVTLDGNTNNVTIMVSEANEIYDNLSLPSSSSSLVHTPEASTPTKEVPKCDSGFPIMRGLKNVLNMFRPSQSPIPPDTSSPPIVISPDTSDKCQEQSASTPLLGQKTKDPLSKNSTNRDSLVFNEDLETELQWHDETTVLFSHEKIPIHKLFFQQSKPLGSENKKTSIKTSEHDNTFDTTVEYMDVSYNDSRHLAKTLSKMPGEVHKNEAINAESDSEFVDCETSFAKNETLVEQSFEPNLEDETLFKKVLDTDSEKMVAQSLNSSVETLNASKCTNLSAAPTETTNAIYYLQPSTIHLENIENLDLQSSSIKKSCEIITEDNIYTAAKRVEVGKTTVGLGSSSDGLVVSNELDMNNIVKKSLTLESDTIIAKDENAKTTPNTENVAITISQIPLIVDPRVLLFNIPSEVEENVNKVTIDVLKVSPTDMPLPDDDEVDNKPICLPVNPLADSSDQTCTPIIENEYEIKQTQHKMCVKIGTENIEVPENILELSTSILPHNQIISENSTGPIHVYSKVNQINSSLASSATENDILQIIDDHINELDMNKVVDESVDCQNIEPMDISLMDANLLNQYSITGIAREVNGNENIGLEVYNTSYNRNQKVKEALTVVTNTPDYSEQKQIVENNLVVLPESVNIMQCELKPEEHNSSEQVIESEMAKEIAYDLGNIKQEVDTIVATAIDIVSDKVAESKEETLNIVTEAQNISVNNNTNKEHKSVNTVIPSETNTNRSITIAKDNNMVNVETIQSSVYRVQDDEEVMEKMNVDQFIENTLKGIPTTNNNTKASNELPNQINVCILSTEGVHVDNTNKKDTELGKISNETEREIVPNKEGSRQSDLTSKYFGNSSLPKVEENLKKVEIINHKNEPIASHEMQPELIKKGNKTLILETSQNAHSQIKTAHYNADNLVNSDEEIVTSGNNSPFVSVSAEIKPAVEPKSESLEKIDNPFTNQGEVAISPPLSPKIHSKGYNLNFDDIENPFATKTKVGVSPPPDSSPNLLFESPVIKKELPKQERNKTNIRNSQTERKKPINCNKKTNLSFPGNLKVNFKTLDNPAEFSPAKSIATVVQEFSDHIDTHIPVAFTDEIIIEKDREPKDCTLKENKSEPLDATQLLTDHVVKYDKLPIECLIANVNDGKGTSSSEQSTYYSADASSSEGIEVKNVFNLPEIDDPDFNPFATNSKIAKSPPPGLDVHDPFIAKGKIRSPAESSMVMDVEAANSTVIFTTSNKNTTAINNDEVNSEIDPDSSHNTSDATVKDVNAEIDPNSSQNTSDATVKTEDADTLEGPFLEVEDMNNDDKMSDLDFENVELMQFSELPPCTEEHKDAGELFIDAEAFEFLLNQQQANTVADSGKESLFLKFDPLFAKRVSSDGVLATLKKVQKHESTPKKMDKPQNDKSVEIPLTMNVTHDIDNSNTTEDSCDDLNVTVSKPMMVVNPAVNPVVTPRNKSITPIRSNRQSLTFTSPAIAVIDRLLCLSANNSLVHDNTIAEVRRDNEADLALTQLRELLADKEISVCNLRSESKHLKDRLSNLESHMKSLEAISEERLKKINELNEKLTEKTKMNRRMAKVVEEYERTIASLIAETEQDRKCHAEERIQLMKERDEQTAHLASMEVSFSDLHSKYEKSKQVILGFKANEDTYKKSLQEFEENLTKMQNNYELLKQHATSKLNHANEELQKINRSHESEVLKLNAMIKRKELHITSLEETLQQKTKANDELTAICDELINKVG